MDADGLSAAGSSASIRVHPRFVEVVLPEKNPEKLLAGYLLNDQEFFHIVPAKAGIHPAT